MSWGSSFEFWLLSTIEENKTRSIIIEEKPHEFDWMNNSPKKFITKWEVFDYQKLPSKYFIMSDTVSTYKGY